MPIRVASERGNRKQSQAVLWLAVALLVLPLCLVAVAPAFGWRGVVGPVTFGAFLADPDWPPGFEWQPGFNYCQATPDSSEYRLRLGDRHSLIAVNR